MLSNGELSGSDHGRHVRRQVCTQTCCVPGTRWVSTVTFPSRAHGSPELPLPNTRGVVLNENILVLGEEGLFKQVIIHKIIMNVLTVKEGVKGQWVRWGAGGSF